MHGRLGYVVMPNNFSLFIFDLEFVFLSSLQLFYIAVIISGPGSSEGCSSALAFDDISIHLFTSNCPQNLNDMQMCF
jgi:hypothetical protein